MKTHALTLLTALVACAPPAVPQDTATYVTQLHPLLQENGLLADKVLEGAADVHDGRASPNTASLVWENEIVPLAGHLHAQAEIVQPPTRWASEHRELVSIWGSRAEGYVLVAEAVNSGDAARWKRGRALADKAKLDEESWFEEVNTRLAPLGIDLDQYP